MSLLVSMLQAARGEAKVSPSDRIRFQLEASRPKPCKHYTLNIDIGGVTGVVAKVVGKLSPSMHVWVAAGTAPSFLRSEGPLYEGGPIWRIELASPTWPKEAQRHQH